MWMSCESLLSFLPFQHFFHFKFSFKRYHSDFFLNISVFCSLWSLAFSRCGKEGPWKVSKSYFFTYVIHFLFSFYTFVFLSFLNSAYLFFAFSSQCLIFVFLWYCLSFFTLVCLFVILLFSFCLSVFLSLNFLLFVCLCHPLLNCWVFH